MKDGRENIHIGPPRTIETTADGTSIGHEVHMTDGFSADEVSDAIAENHGLDPDTFEIKRTPTYTDSEGNSSTSFSGSWRGSNWKPQGTTPNYGYKPNMN
jgi:hypothetical protein